MTSLDKPACSVCATSLSVHQQLRGGICDQPACRQEKIRRDLLKRREQRAILRDKALARRDALMPEADCMPVTLLPVNLAALAVLPQQRRQAFLANLSAAVEQAASAASADDDERDQAPSQGGPAALGQGCALCRGHCCFTGGDHGYVDAQVVRRYRSANPQAGAQEIIDAFVACLPARSYAGSCIYHGESGCGLPRAVRSDYCIAYLCEGLKALRDDLKKDPSRATFAAATREQEIIRTAVLNQSDNSTA